MRLDQLSAGLEGVAALDVRGSDGAAEITGLAYDSRAAGPGDLFFCVPGFRSDGHDFAARAVANGAAALVVERPLDSACRSCSCLRLAPRWALWRRGSSATRRRSCASWG